MWLCMRKVRNFVPWLHHEPKESVCFKIPNVVSQVLNAILTKSGVISESTEPFSKKTCHLLTRGWGMGHWRELWVESVVPLKPYPLKYLNPFTLLPCLETSVSENISSVSLWFLVSIKFFRVYESHHQCGPRATKRWRHIPVLLVLKCTSRSVYPLKGDNRCKTL